MVNQSFRRVIADIFLQERQIHKNTSPEKFHHDIHFIIL